MGFGDFVKSAAGGNIIGSAIGAVGSLIGGGMKNNAAEAQAALQYQHQKEFAQNGVRWKVADAKAAGIHPLAALGAQTFSYNPVMTTPGDNGVGDALRTMGQGISRASEAKALAEERALNAEARRKANELTDAQIAKTNAETNFVNQQALASQEAIAKTAQVPPMSVVNSTKNMDTPIKSYGWLKDERGKVVGIVPSEDLKNRTEDVFGVEWVPWLGSTARNVMAKLFGQEVDGMYWHGIDKGFLPHPPKKNKGFFDYAKDVIDYNSRNYD